MPAYGMGGNRRYTREQLVGTTRPEGSFWTEELFYTIEEWTSDGGEIVEMLARVAVFAIAKAAFEAACRDRPHAHITFRNRALVHGEQKASSEIAARKA